MYEMEKSAFKVWGLSLSQLPIGQEIRRVPSGGALGARAPPLLNKKGRQKRKGRQKKEKKERKERKKKERKKKERKRKKKFDKKNKDNNINNQNI